MSEKSNIPKEVKEALDSASPQDLQKIYDLMVSNLVSSEKFSQLFIDGVDNLLYHLFQLSFPNGMKLERKDNKHNEITYSNKHIEFFYYGNSLSIRFSGYSTEVDLKIFGCSFLGPEIFIPFQKEHAFEQIEGLRDIVREKFGTIDCKKLCFMDFASIFFVCKFQKDDFRFMIYDIKTKNYTMSG